MNEYKLVYYKNMNEQASIFPENMSDSGGATLKHSAAASGTRTIGRRFMAGFEQSVAGDGVVCPFPMRHAGQWMETMERRESLSIQKAKNTTNGNPPFWGRMARKRGAKTG